MHTYERVLELLKRADLTVERAHRLGIDRLDHHIENIRKKGYDVQCIKTGTYAYFGEKE